MLGGRLLMQITSKIYVAGHRGLAGSAIVRSLRAKGYHNVTTRAHTELDLEREQAVDAFFAKERPEYVFLAAGKVGGIHANNTYPVDFLLRNIRIQNNVIESSWKHSVKRLLFLGSSCIYPKHAPQPLKEEYLLSGYLEPTNEPYAIAKIAGIKLCEAFNRQFGTCFMSVMPTNLYGPNDNYDLETSHVLAAMIRKFHLAKLASDGNFKGIANDEERYGAIPDSFLACLAAIARERGHTAPPAITARVAVYDKAMPAVTLWGSGSPRREFLYSDDLADACVFLMERVEELMSSGAIAGHTSYSVNIGYGEDLSIRQLAELAAGQIGCESDLLWDASRPDGTPQKLMDISVMSSLGWKPATSLHEGIRKTYDAYMR
jgi:GDP-L-fucose synthase